MPAISLREFSQFVPVCAGTDSVMAVWDLFREKRCSQLVVVDSHQSPLGILQLQALVAYLFPPSVEQLEAEQSEAESELAKINWQLTIEEASRAVRRSLIQPLSTLPIHCTIDEFYPYLQTTLERQWILVDTTGRYVSVLDFSHVWQLVAAYPQPSLAPSLTDVILSSTHSSELPSSILIHLLEQLPLPLMLQTSGGRVIAQNLAWRQQVGELNNPVELRQEAATVLEAIASSTNGDVLRHRYALNPYQTTNSQWDGFKAEQDTISSTLCRLGTDEDTCVCLCATKDGQERVWQFSKISLKAIVRSTHSTQPTSLEGQRLSQPMNSARPFHLAAFNEDETISINQTSLVEPEDLWLVLAQDTTEKQQVTRELAAKNADLIQINRLKDEFLACISHELKTPLTAILGLSNLLKDQQLGELNDRQLRYAKLIYQSGRHLISIVNNILDLTRIETKQLELVPELVQIKTVCNRAYEQAKHLLTIEKTNRMEEDGALEAEFALTIQSGLSTIVADEMRLRQMLANLISNALKFTPSQGRIGLTVENWEGWIAFTVWDTGIGIAADKQHLIFQKFQQLENPLTRRFEGTGLGLVLTQRLARLHGGDITFTSTEDEGSQFTLLLPPNPPRTGLIPSAIEQSNVPATSNCLAIIVESAPEYLQTLTLQLAELGYRVAIARSGTEALEKIRRLQPMVVFLNPMLPLLSGWDVLTLLKLEEGTRHIPIIVTATQADRDQARNMGADGLLTPPMTLKSIEQVLDRAVHPSNQVVVEVNPLKLTVLHLHSVAPLNATPSSEPIAALNLQTLFHPHNCRVLEVDDLEQAELLARVWKPNLILLDGWIPDPVAFLKQLSQSPFLAALPLVTLTPEVTQAANQINGLSVFPCLDPFSPQKPIPPSRTPVPALLQVLQVAAGMNWMPHILVADLTLLASSHVLPTQLLQSPTDPKSYQWTSWLQAFGQYTNTAGFRNSIGRSWDEIEQVAQGRTVNLLLICVRYPIAPAAHLEGIKSLLRVKNKPPILVWYQSEPPSLPQSESLDLLLEAIATNILPASTSMQELLEEIHKTLTSPVT
jgi:signal transduction histidine kinase/CheY-like chemotaxis protein